MVSLSALVLAQSALWLVVIATLATAFLLLGRVRAFYRQIAPLGALAPLHAASETLPATALTTLAGTARIIGGQRDDGRSILLTFVSGTCPVSRKMAPIVQDFSRYEGLDYVFLGDDTDTAQRAALQRLGIAADRFVNDAQIGRLLGADRVPFAVLVDDQGIITARGLVNNREHLESLLAVRETGHDSIQSYLDAHPTALKP